MKTTAIIKEIKKRQDALAKERDKLRGLLSEIEGLHESCDRAWCDLQSAVDTLSELV